MKEKKKTKLKFISISFQSIEHNNFEFEQFVLRELFQFSIIQLAMPLSQYKVQYFGFHDKYFDTFGRCRRINKTVIEIWNRQKPRQKSHQQIARM